MLGKRLLYIKTIFSLIIRYFSLYLYRIGNGNSIAKQNAEKSTMFIHLHGCFDTL